MKSYYLIFTITSLAALGMGSCTTEKSFTVEHSGALMQIMSGNIDATSDLGVLKGKPHLYALGAAENLHGEIQIFDGEPFYSTVTDSDVAIGPASITKASLLVYASIEEWESINIPNSVTSMADLEAFVSQAAQQKNWYSDKPFPFLISGKVAKLSWHVIQWDIRDTEHSHAKHKSSGLQGILNQEDVDILGFYSEKHKGIFTHHSTNMHLHFKTSQGELAGHVDDLSIGAEMILKLPK